MKDFDCQDVDAVLSGLLDGELDREMDHLAEVHLSQCASCRSMLERAERQDADMRAVMHNVYEDWTEHVEQAIWSAVNGPQRAFATERRLRVAAWTGWLTAAAACVLAGVSLFGPRPWQGRNPTPEIGDATARNETAAPRSDSANDSTAVATSHGRSASHASGSSDGVYDDGPGINGNWPDAFSLLRLDSSLSWSVSQSVSNRRPMAATVFNSQDQTTRTMPLNMRAANHLRYDTFADSQRDRLLEGYYFDERTFEIFEQMLAMRTRVTDGRIANCNMMSDVGAGPDFATERPDILTVGNTESRAVEARQIMPALGLSDDLYHASVLLNVLAGADDSSFRDVQLIREAIESDRLLDRLAQAGSRLSADEEAIVNQAWTALEFVNGPVDQVSLRRLQGIIRDTGVANRVEELSGRVVN